MIFAYLQQKNRRIKEVVHDSKFVLFFAVTITLNIMGFLDSIFFDKNLFNLMRFTDRTIGGSILAGVDAALRLKVLVAAVFCFCIIFILALHIISDLMQYLNKIVYDKFALPDKRLILVLMQLLCIVFATKIFLGNVATYAVLCLDYLIFLLCVCTFIKCKIIIKDKNDGGKILTIKRYENFSFFIIGYSLIATIIVMALSSQEQIALFSSKYLILHFIFFILTCMIAIKYRSRLNKLVNVLGIMFLAPICIFLSSEIQFMLIRKFSIVISTKLVFYILIALLVCISITIYQKSYCDSNEDRKLLLQTRKKISNIYYPQLLIFMVLLYTYKYKIYLNNIDYLHGGNCITPTQQLFQFGLLPFVDYKTGRGLVDYAYSSIYSLFYGYSGLESMAWGDFFWEVVTVLICYFVLKKFFKPITSLVMIIFLPMSDWINPYYVVALVPLLFISDLLKNKTIYAYSKYFVILLLTFAWMLSVGKITILASIPIILLSIRDVKTFKNVYISAISIFGVTFALFCIVIILRGHDLTDVLKQYLAFSKADFDIQSYSIVALPNQMNGAVIYYILCPILFISTLFFIMLKNKKLEEFDYLTLYIAFASFVCSFRGLARHCILEGNFIYDFYLLLLIVLPFVIFNNRRKLSKQLSFIIILLLIISIPQVRTNALIDKMVLGEPSLYRWQLNEERVIEDGSEVPTDFIEFVDKYLEDDETFFEFVNAHLLYALTNKKNPFFQDIELVLQSQSVNEIYVKEFKEKYKDGEIPIVVFDSDWWGKNIDGVPTEVASFKIAEFIYSNYEPYIILDGFHVWVAKNSNLKDRVSNDIKKQKELEQIVFKTNFNKNDKKLILSDINVVSKQGEDNIFVCGNIDPQINNVMNEKEIQLNEGKSYYVEMTAKSSVQGNIQMFFSFDGESYLEGKSYKVGVGNNDGFTKYIFKVPKEHEQELTNIRIDPPNNSNFQIREVYLYEKNKDEISDNIKTNIVQNHNLIKLPYIWANYDEYGALQNTKVLSNLNNSEHEFFANEPLKLLINKSFSKKDGNYLYLQITSNETGTMTVFYGEKGDSYSFELIPSKEPIDYLIRVSSQYNWVNYNFDSLTLISTTNVTLQKADIRQGD